MRRAVVAIVSVGLSVTAASAQPLAPQSVAPAVSITADGTLIVQGAGEVPPYGPGGRWVEGTARTTSRNAVRVFRFMGPSGPPVIELFLNRDLTNAAPAGVFELGFVEAFLDTFATGAGFTRSALAIADTTLAGAPAKRCRGELTKAGEKLWLYAWIFPRNPSLTFLAIRPDAGAMAEIETYLQSVRFR